MPDRTLGHAHQPLVSVIIPSYNHAPYIEQSVRAVLDQTYGNIELIVVDDCSKDDSAIIAARLAAALGFTFVRNERNSGVNHTLETGFALAKGDYLAVVASDDVLLPDKTADQIAYLLRTGLDGVYGTCMTLAADGRRELVDLGDLEPAFADGTALERIYTDSSHAPLLQSALIRRECLLSLCEERRKFKSDDWVTLIRLMERFRIGFVNKPQFLYRQHDNNTYRDYWGTMPQRVEVLAQVTPEHLRARGLANMFRDQALYLYMDGKTGGALKFQLASMMLHPSPGHWARTIGGLGYRLLRQAGRRLKGR